MRKKVHNLIVKYFTMHDTVLLIFFNDCAAIVYEVTTINGKGIKIVTAKQMLKRLSLYHRFTNITCPLKGRQYTRKLIKCNLSNHVSFALGKIGWYNEFNADLIQNGYYIYQFWKKKFWSS